MEFQRKPYRQKSSAILQAKEALHQQRSFRKGQLQQQQRDSQRSLRAEASILASQSFVQLNAESRAMEYDISAEKGRVPRNPDGEICNLS